MTRYVRPGKISLGTVIAVGHRPAEGMVARFLYRGRASVDMVVVAEERMEEVAGGELRGREGVGDPALG